MPRFLLLLLSPVLLIGCSNKFSDVNSTIATLYDSYQDIELTPEQLEQIPYPSAYVRLDDGRQIYMVLAFIDTNPKTGAERLSWIASDRAMIITENGRIIKTVGLPGANISALEGASHTLADAPASWQATYDWMPDYRFGFSASVSTKKQAEDYIESQLWAFNASHYTEQVTFKNGSFTNHYWLDSNQQVVKTLQYLGPDMTKVEMTFLKTYAKQQEN